MTKVKDMPQAVAKGALDIPVELLMLSPEETRKTINQATLKELAESIGKEGVIERLLVRPVAMPQVQPGGVLYEIVAGQRRWLASKIAGKATCPCDVREMSDEEARAARIISNLQREDLPPLEEAEGFERLLAEPGATIQTVAAKVGKSAGDVGRRLKLLDAIEPVRRALKCGVIEVGHALELVRLGVVQQQELLDWLDVGYRAPEEGDEQDGQDDGEYDQDGICKYCGVEDDTEEPVTWSDEAETVCSSPECVARAAAMGGWRPTRYTVGELRQHIARTQLRILANAPFPLEDEIPPMACTECPRRSGGSGGLFEDLAQETCADRACYDAKVAAWIKAELERADRDEKKLVKLYDGHTNDKAGVIRWNVTVGAECASQEPAIWMSGRLMGRRVAICRDKKCATHGAAAAPSTSGKASGSKGGTTPKISAEEKAKAEAQKAERLKLQQKVEAERAYRERLWKELFEAEIPDAAEANLVRRVCAAQAVQSGDGLIARLLGLPDDALDWNKRVEAFARVSAMPYRVVVRAAVLASVVGEVAVSEYSVSQGVKPEQMEALAGIVGLDVAAIRAGKPSKAAAPNKGSKPVSGKKAASAAAKKVPTKKATKPPAKKAAAKPAKKKAGKR